MELLLILCFIIGYGLIVSDQLIKLDKAVPALLTGIVCWVVYAFSESDQQVVSHELVDHISEISGILFFLMGAMAIVELIDLHNGFSLITQRITTTSKRTLIIIVSILAFFLSAILDNL